MNLGNSIKLSIICGLPLALAACSGSTTEAPAASGLATAMQEQTVDPDGLTTEFTFSTAVGSVVAANFEANGGQTAQTATLVGNVATVVWDQLVTPTHQVRVVGITGVPQDWVAVSTTDASAPDFVISAANMVAGQGGDNFTVTFSGPRVVEVSAESPANWALVVSGTTLDMTGSTFALDPNTQIMTVTLGSTANLHSTFTFAASTLTSVAGVGVSTTLKNGTASGDAGAPSIVSAIQNLTNDEFGRVIDYTFDEAMDPVFCAALSNFGISLPDIATNVTSPSDNVLRVTFSRPMIPGTDNVTLANLVDVHGNAYVGGVTAITQPSPVANSYATEEAMTVENAGNDYIHVVLGQALVVSEAEDDTNWTLVVDGSGITMADQTITYDLLTKDFRIDLDFDMNNGDVWTLTPGAITEVDGETWSTAATGAATGDVAAVVAILSLQNRTMAANGMTVDVTLSEDVEQTPAELTGNWSVSGGVSVLSATLLPNANSVRLVCDTAVTPGDYTVGCDALEDLAGNVMAGPQTGVTVFTTDATAPTTIASGANAVAGPDNDSLRVYFNDDMIATEVSNLVNWAFESPIGSARDMTGTTISYNSALREATLVFVGSGDIDLQGVDSYRVTATNLRDIAGNTIASGVQNGAVVSESTAPFADFVWYDSVAVDQISVYFSEHCERLDDLYTTPGNVAGSRYDLYTSGGAYRGRPISATVLEDGLGVQLNYGFIINASDTLDVLGVTDLAGNYMFPVQGLALVLEDASEAAHNAVASPIVCVSGLRNDTLEVRFDLRMSPWGIEDPANYVINDGVADIDLTNATFAFDGVSTVMITLGSTSAESFYFARAHSITVSNLFTAQGVELSAPIVEAGVNPAGDNVVPTVGVSDVVIDPATANSVLVHVDEALDTTEAEDETNYDYNTGNIATSASLIEPGVVRVTFGVQPVIGLDIAFDVTDLAHNVTGTLTRTVAAGDAGIPLLTSVSGTSIPGEGGDMVFVIFNETVDPSSATTLTNYTVTNGTAMSLVGASMVHDTISNSVTILLAAGVELDANLTVNVGVANVLDVAGNAMSSTPVILGGAVSGDLTGPSIAMSFVNFREETGGYDVDVLFNEDVDATFATDIFNWTCSGGQVVIDVQMVSANHAHVTLLGAILVGDSIEILSGLPDSAGNTAGALTDVIIF